MKEAVIKRVKDQRCSKELGGCGKKLKEGETVMRKMRQLPKNRARSQGESTRYLCLDCYDKVSV